MKITLLTSVAALALMGTAAMAQTTAPKNPTAPRSVADCRGDFTKADRNKDGRLDKTELTSLGKAVPTTLASSTNVSQAEFMSACGGTGSTNGNAGGPGSMPGKTGSAITK